MLANFSFKYFFCILLPILLNTIYTLSGIEGVARFAIKSVGTRSVVIEMVDAQNVSRFDMRVLIYDMEKLREFRRSELTGARYNSQLFSFDGLIPANWFAFRIEYRLVYDHQQRRHQSNQQQGKNAGKGSSAIGGDYGTKDLSTKQELVVRTRPEKMNSGKSLQSAEIVASSSASNSDAIEDELIKFERVQLFPELHQINVTLLPALTNMPRVSTLVVAELRCARGTVKPAAQQIPDKGTILSFDLSRVHPGPLSYRDALARLKCLDLCIFPFIRVEASPQSGEPNANKHRHTFRAREICQSLKDDDDSQSHGAMSDMKRPGVMAADELQQKLLERHFRGTSSSGISGTKTQSSQHRILLQFLSSLPIILMAMPKPFPHFVMY